MLKYLSCVQRSHGRGVVVVVVVVVGAGGGGDSPLGGTGGGKAGREDRKAGRGGTSRDFFRRGGSGGGSEPGGCLGLSVKSHKCRYIKQKPALASPWQAFLSLPFDGDKSNQKSWCEYLCYRHFSIKVNPTTNLITFVSKY